MQTREIQIEVIECGITGEIGLAPKGANITADDYMADTTGVLMAHDLLEHVNGAEHIGGIGDELEALGAIWYGRGQTGSLNRRDPRQGSAWTIEQNIAHDISRMALEYSYKGFDRAIPKSQETDADDSFREILEYGRQYADQEAECDEQDAEALTETDYFDHCLAFMQAGYLKAEATHDCPYEYANLFWTVADALRPYAEHAEYVGQEYTLTITEDGRAFVEEYYETEDELSCDDCGDYFDPEQHDGHRVNPNGYTQCRDCVEIEEAA